MTSKSKHVMYILCLGLMLWSWPSHSAENELTNPETSIEELVKFADNEASEYAKISQRPANTRIFVISKSGIKYLNETAWNPLGTENYLELFHLRLSRALESNPKFGRIFQSSFKHHYIVSTASEADFQNIILQPLIQQLANELSEKNPRINWQDFLTRNIIFLAGSDIADLVHANGKNQAHVRGLPLIEYPRTPDEWREQARSLRQKLFEQMAANNVSWESFLSGLHYFLGKANGGYSELKNWLNLRGLGNSAPDAQRYFIMLQAVDILPFRKNGNHTQFDPIEFRRQSPLSPERYSWEVERRISLQLARKAKFILTTDIVNLGFTSRRYQDLWVAKGANFNDITTNYLDISNALEEITATLHAEMKQIVGRNFVLMNRGGDELTWFFDHLSAEKMKQIEMKLDHFRRSPVSFHNIEMRIHHSGLFTVNDGQLAYSLIRASKAAKTSFTTTPQGIHFSEGFIGSPVRNVEFFHPEAKVNRVVHMGNGHLISIDNRGLLHAQQNGGDFKIEIIDASTPIPADLAKASKLLVALQKYSPGESPLTWGELVQFIAANQKFYTSRDFPLLGTLKLPDPDVRYPCPELSAKSLFPGL